jgi:phosphate acyltransferase
MAVRVAIDAMGGDAAPDVVIEGVARLLESAGEAIDISLVGPEETLRERAGAIGDHSRVHFVDAPEVIEMDEPPAAALKGKPRSSIHLGLGSLGDGRADAFVSAGNTGAVMAAAMLLLGRLPAVSRPALPTIFPTLKGHCVVLDVGANMDCRPEHLVQFAQMGSVYSERVLGCERPRVGLLNVGEEPSKGNDAAKAAHALLSDTDLNFVGNVEGGDLMLDAADVVVCDGFVGNVLLKFGESIKTVLPALIRGEVAALGTNSARDESLALLQRVLGGVMKRFSYEEFGGTPLLGVDGNVLIGHGGSSSRAIARMIEVAAEVVRSDVRGTIAGALATQG